MLLIIFLVAVGARPCWGANRAFLQLRDFKQVVGLSYGFEDYYLETQGSKAERIFHLTEQQYQLDFGYVLYSTRVLKGSVTLGAQALQQFGDESGGSQETRLNYDINGTAFRLKLYPVSFHLGSSVNRVSPPFARSYQQQIDQRSASLTLKNYYLPATVSVGRTVYETSGQVEDHQDTLDNFDLAVSHDSADGTSSSSASLVTQRAVIVPLSGTGVQQDNYAVSGSLSNLFQPSPGGALRRSLTSSFTWGGEDGTHEGKNSMWRETLDWQLGKVLRSELYGELSSTSSGDQWRDERRGRGMLEHRLLETLTTRIEAESVAAKVPGGSEESAGGVLKLSYLRYLPRSSHLALDYFYGQRVTDSEAAGGSLFYRDERLNAAAVETANYLAKNDIIPATLVVWNATRTRTYLPGADYSVVADGRRTRLRIEPAGNITIGDPLSVDYSAAIDPRLKFQTDSQGIAAAVNLWDVYFLSASYTASTAKKLTGRDDISPVGPESTLLVKGERVQPTHRSGFAYSNMDSSSLKVQKLEAYWRYAEEFDDSSAVTANLSDLVSMYQETATPAGVVTKGGTSNDLRLSGMYRRDFTDKLKVSVHGEVGTSNGRSTNQQLIAGWLRGTYLVGRLETEFNLRSDWRFFKEQYQRNITARIDLKRRF